MILSRFLWPWALSVPLLMGGFAASVFFVGTDSVLFAPFILCLLFYAALAVGPNFAEGWALPRTATFWTALLFGLWLVLVLPFSTTPLISTTFTVILCILPGFFAVNVTARHPARWTAVHASALFAVIGGFAVWALAQYFVLFSQYGPRIHHPMLNPNNLAGLFNLGLFPAAGLFFILRGRRAVLAGGLLTAVFYGALLVTQSRGAFLGCLLSMPLLCAAALWRHPVAQGAPWRRVVFLAALLIVLPCLLDMVHAGEILDKKALALNTHSTIDRVNLWRSTWAMIRDHFWIGTGLASFYFYYPRYRAAIDHSDGFFAHMDPLQFWAETGVITPILFYAVLICILLRTIRAIRGAGSDRALRLAVVAPFCGMLALVGHTHITFHLYMPGMLLPLSGLLSFWYMATERALGDAETRWCRAPAGRARLAAAGAFLLAALVVGGWTLRVSATTAIMAQVEKETARKHEDIARAKLALAGRIAPPSYGRTCEYEARFRIAPLLQNAKIKTMPRTQVRTLYDEAVAYLDCAQVCNPAFTVPRDLRARALYAVDGILITDGTDQAIAILMDLLADNPMAAESRIVLANIYSGRGQTGKALKVLQQGVKWPRSKGMVDITFLVTLARAELVAGNKQAHAAYMREAQRRAQKYGIKTMRVPG